MNEFNLFIWVWWYLGWAVALMDKPGWQFMFVATVTAIPVWFLQRWTLTQSKRAKTTALEGLVEAYAKTEVIHHESVEGQKMAILYRVARELKHQTSEVALLTDGCIQLVRDYCKKKPDYSSFDSLIRAIETQTRHSPKLNPELVQTVLVKLKA